MFGLNYIQTSEATQNVARTKPNNSYSRNNLKVEHSSPIYLILVFLPSLRPGS